jgi:UPF0716 family protein affecting phage T7 exclusion
MVRILLLLISFWLGFTVLRESGWDLFHLDEKLAWAMLLPATYVLGLVLLRE